MLFSAGERAWGVRCGCRRGLIALEKHYNTALIVLQRTQGKTGMARQVFNGNYLAYRHTLVLMGGVRGTLRRN